MMQAGTVGTSASQGSRGARPRLRRFNGQHTFEYAAVMAVVGAALIGMMIYLKRGVSGRLRDASDAVGGQYAPRETTSDLVMTVKGTTITTSELLVDQEVKIGGNRPPVTADVMQHQTTVKETTNRTGTEDVGPMQP